MTQSFSPPSSRSPSPTPHLIPATVSSTHLGSAISRSQRRHLGDAESTQADGADFLQILIASDCHLGYADRDEMRKMDSFNTFEEVLLLAKENGVDFVLLGGDLFHENKPSRFTAQNCAALLRKHCMGNTGEIKFDLVSDPKVNFAHIQDKKFRRLNTSDPDLNISLPVFSIHGNHDDPSGQRYLSELDVLHTYGLINYFGKVDNIDDITIEPVLLRKGNTSLALYGLGSIRDERLHRAYMDGKVKMVRPTNMDDYFNIFVLHQNRPTMRGPTNYIPEKFIAAWLDVIVWGHEHDAIPVPVLNKEKGFETLQPGSTVATSMSDGEGKQKCCYLLQVYRGQFRVQPIPLTTVRPFVIEEVNLAAVGFKKDDSNANEIRHEVEKFLVKKMERIMRRVETERTPKQPKEPLIRLRVDYGNIEPLNPIVFGQHFLGKVANPRDIILPLKPKAPSKGASQHKGSQIPMKPLITIDPTSIEDLVVDYFKSTKEDMVVVDPKVFTEALRQFVHSGDKDILPDMYEYQKLQIQNYLGQTDLPPLKDASQLGKRVEKYRADHTNIPDAIKEFTDWRMKTKNPQPLKARGGARGRGVARASATPLPTPSSGENGIQPTLEPTPSTSRGRGRGARGGARGGRGRGRGRAGASRDPESESDEDVVEISPVSSPPAKRGRTARSRPAALSSRQITDFFSPS